MTSTDVVVRSAIAITPEQTEFNAPQLAALERMGLRGVPQGDLDLFLHRCKHTGLDPFERQISLIPQRRTVIQWPNGQRLEEFVTEYVTHTNIDGYRVLGNRLAEERGDELDQEEAFWCGPDGRWVDIWLDRENPPVAAKFTIVKNGKAKTGKVHYSEYFQADEDGEPNATWRKRPAGQLAKCAEALAWRMAYPQDFSGMQLDIAAAVKSGGSSSERARSKRVSAAGILGARRSSAAPDPGAKPDTEQVPEPGQATAKKAPAKKAAQKKTPAKKAPAKRATTTQAAKTERQRDYALTQAADSDGAEA